jgi:flagellar biosynthetic protein FliO
MEDGSQWMMLLRTLGSLALVVGLILALAWVAKRFLRLDRWSSVGSEIKILQSFMLGAKRQLMVIEVEDKRILIGVAQDSISTICELEGRKSPPIERQKEISYEN